VTDADLVAAWPPARPPVRTFKPRRRPLTSARADLLERLSPIWCLAETGAPIDARAVFERSAPVVLDIGIGLGETATAMAALDPATDTIGVDVHTPGIASTLARIEATELTNLRLVHGDALVFLDRVPPGSLAGIRIFFPDPWPKARHRHRRMATPQHVARFAAALRSGGWIHLATDIDDYALQMQRVCDEHPRLTGGVVARPDTRPITRYERKGLAAGRSTTDLLYRRTG
jgi:tRNA (guanine-N7-)-methyltransferase